MKPRAKRKGVGKVELVEPGREPLLRGRPALAVHGDRRLPDRLDALEDGRAFLLADHVAEETSEQAETVDQRLESYWPPPR